VDLSGMNPAWSAQALVAHIVVEEVVAGAVVFEWDSASFPSLYADSVYDNQFKANVLSDYLHLNSMCIDPADGNFILSFRNTSSIVKVDRKTGAILWTLGGKEDDFGLTGSQVFAFQHYVRAQADGSLWVFDNDSAPPARILSFVLDEVNRKVVSFTDVYDQPSSQPWAQLMGSYAKLGAGRTLFGWGEWLSGTVAPGTTEVSNGAVVWSLTFEAAETFTYRALPIPAL
jgi:arylsulfate sulfotransferase